MTSAGSTSLCVACGREILDRYVLCAMPGPLQWHATCLRCDECGHVIDESSRTCYLRHRHVYCSSDFQRSVAAWPSGAVVKAQDLRSRSRRGGFNSPRPSRCQELRYHYAKLPTIDRPLVDVRPMNQLAYTSTAYQRVVFNPSVAMVFFKRTLQLGASGRVK